MAAVEALERLLSVKSAAVPLGIAARTLRDLVAQGRVEAVRIGGAIRIRQSTVEDLIRNGTSTGRKGSPAES